MPHIFTASNFSGWLLIYQLFNSHIMVHSDNIWIWHIISSPKRRNVVSHSVHIGFYAASWFWGYNMVCNSLVLMVIVQKCKFCKLATLKLRKKKSMFVGINNLCVRNMYSRIVRHKYNGRCSFVIKSDMFRLHAICKMKQHNNHVCMSARQSPYVCASEHYRFTVILWILVRNLTRSSHFQEEYNVFCQMSTNIMLILMGRGVLVLWSRTMKK